MPAGIPIEVMIATEVYEGASTTNMNATIAIISRINAATGVF